VRALKTSSPIPDAADEDPAERIAADDASGVARLVRRLSGALLSGSYRYDTGEWKTAEEAKRHPWRTGRRLSPGGIETHRPYFETRSSRRRRRPTG